MHFLLYIEDYTISSSATSLDRDAFCYCNNLKKIHIPSSIKEVSRSCFNSCENLTEAILEEGVTSIGQTAFYHCKSLKKVVLPKTVNKFAYAPFNGASLDKLVIPSSVLSLPNDMVSFCPLTEGLYIEAENSETFTLTATCLSFIGKNAKVYVKNEEIKNKINKVTSFSLDRIIIYSGNE